MRFDDLWGFKQGRCAWYAYAQACERRISLSCKVCDIGAILSQQYSLRWAHKRSASTLRSDVTTGGRQLLSTTSDFEPHAMERCISLFPPYLLANGLKHARTKKPAEFSPAKVNSCSWLLSRRTPTQETIHICTRTGREARYNTTMSLVHSHNGDS